MSETDNLTKLIKQKKEEFPALLEAGFESAPIGIAFLDLDLRFIRVNRVLADMNGVPVEDHSGRRVDEVIPEVESAKEIMESWRQVIETGKPMLNMEVRGKTPGSNDIKYWSENWYPVRVRGEITGLAVIAVEITEQKMLEKALFETVGQGKKMDLKGAEVLEKTNIILKEEIEKRKKYEQDLKKSSERIIREYEQRKYLSARLVELLEKDRLDIAMTLHDHVGQIVTALKMNIERAESKLKDHPVQDDLATAREKAVETIRFVRNVSRRLRPPALDDFGLETSIRLLIEEVKSDSGFDINFFCGSIPGQMDKDKEIAIYRIAQEALNNAVKHSAAREVFVNLSSREGFITMTIEDNGIGFSYEGLDKFDQKDSPLGITIMRERAILAGGKFRIDSSPDRGTFILVEIPVN